MGIYTRKSATTSK